MTDELRRVLLDIATPAFNCETLFSGFPTPPRNLSREVCIACFEAFTDGEKVVCDECDKHLRGAV